MVTEVPREWGGNWKHRDGDEGSRAEEPQGIETVGSMVRRQ